MKKILITGINGFLGRHLLNELVNTENFPNLEEIVGIDNFISSNKSLDNMRLLCANCYFVYNGSFPNSRKFIKNSKDEEEFLH